MNFFDAKTLYFLLMSVLRKGRVRTKIPGSVLHIRCLDRLRLKEQKSQYGEKLDDDIAPELTS